MTQNVFILGSCVSRDSFEFVKNNFKISCYCARTSLASTFDPQVLDNGSFSNYLENNKNIVMEKFKQRVLIDDLCKKVESKISNTDYSIFILDLIDERFRLAETSLGGYYTYTNEAKQSSFHLYKKTKIKLLPFDSDKKFKLWTIGADKLFNLLNKKDCKIFLNKLYWTDTINSEEQFSTEMLDSIKKNNESLEKMYNYISDNFNINVIEYNKSLLKADVNHKWGLTPFHYTVDVYKHFINSLELFLANSTST